MTVGLEAQFVLTTRNAENELCYKKSDIVTVEIKNDGGYNCATEAQVHDNKDCSYFAKEAGTRQTSVMVNGEDVSCCPFTVQVNPGSTNLCCHSEEKAHLLERLMDLGVWQ